jgi:outer membrane autotransporter protein
MAKNWYLNLDLTDTFKTVINTPQVLLTMARAGFSSLEKRMGDLRLFNDSDNFNGLWTRGYYQQTKITDLVATDLSVLGAEMGYDIKLPLVWDNNVYLGVMAGYMYAYRIYTEDRYAPSEDFHSIGTGAAPSAGAYLLWLNGWGSFIDLTARNYWSRLDMTSYPSEGEFQTIRPNHNILAASGELGHSIRANVNGGVLRIEPKGGIRLVKTGGNTTRTNLDYELRYGTGNYAAGRVALLIGYETVTKHGLRIEPIAEAALNKEFKGKETITYDGVPYKNDISGQSLEITGGFNAFFGENAYLFFSADYEKGSKIESFGANAGVRLKF